MKLSEILSLNEIELQNGGDLSPVTFDDERKQDYKNKQLDLYPEIPTIEPNVPKGYRHIGNMGEYAILTKSEDHADVDYRGREKAILPGFVYVIALHGKPVGYVHAVEKSSEYYNLRGKGLWTKAVFVEDEARGKNLALKFYYWLLTHVCDYILPDDSHTHAGAALWRRLNQSRLFDMYVYDPNTGMARKRWAGKDWNQIYNGNRLQPFLTVKGRWVDFMIMRANSMSKMKNNDRTGLIVTRTTTEQEADDHLKNHRGPLVIKTDEMPDWLREQFLKALSEPMSSEHDHLNALLDE